VSIPPRSIDAGVGIGEIFLEKYRVDAILGHGGMGVVALCTHLALNERVAIKMLRRDVLDDADAVERFMREAQAASKLKSEYVARVTDVGRSVTNVPYMVMEYLEGHDLGELLAERGSIGLPWAIELTLQVCEALAEAHSIGIVHRDIKPTNLFVTWRPDGSALIKVLDFGISKALASGALELTQTQSLLGTPAYMSPEQMRSARQVDARTDIWSLGTVLYELLEGRRPFEAESFSEMCVKVAIDAPGEMTKTPAALQQVLLRCLEKLPEQRYASMAELGAELVSFAHDPHQAQVLVERMARTLRRSQIADWDAGHGVSRTVRPLSAERPVVSSDPAIAMDDLSQAATAAAGLPSDTLAVSRRSPRQRALLVVMALTVAASIGVVVSLARDPVPAPTSRAPEPVVRAPVAKPSADPLPPTAGPELNRVKAGDLPPTAGPELNRVKADDLAPTAGPELNRVRADDLPPTAGPELNRVKADDLPPTAGPELNRVSEDELRPAAGPELNRVRADEPVPPPPRPRPDKLAPVVRARTVEPAKRETAPAPKSPRKPACDVFADAHGSGACPPAEPGRHGK